MGGDADLDDKAKARALQKLYAKGAPVRRPKSVTVIAKKGKGPASPRRGTKIVDRCGHTQTHRPSLMWPSLMWSSLMWSTGAATLSLRKHTDHH